MAITYFNWNLKKLNFDEFSKIIIKNKTTITIMNCNENFCELIKISNWQKTNVAIINNNFNFLKITLIWNGILSFGIEESYTSRRYFEQLFEFNDTVVCQ